LIPKIIHTFDERKKTSVERDFEAISRAERHTHAPEIDGDEDFDGTAISQEETTTNDQAIRVIEAAHTS
jgi:hypothetical protein